MSVTATHATPNLNAEGTRTTAVGIWLAVVCGMVFVMVLLGGATRLTESGLSMVEWQPFTVLPPLTEAQWQDTFTDYQDSPQYRLKNHGMTLAEFKGIFWLEYVHRLWGRAIGFVVLLPLLWFAVRGALSRPLAWRMGGLFVLGGLQGALGWFMVASGLVDRPEVSQYRLAAHLGLAVVLYGALVWTALTWRHPAGAPSITGRRALALAAMVFVTVISGAFVAGLDAGLVYNTFPLMDGRLVPTGLHMLSPWWANHFENVTMVQFQHRGLAVGTVIAALVLRWWLRDRLPSRRARLAADAMAAMALVQAGLGILTLLLAVPMPLGVAHQGGALLLLTLILWLVAECGSARRPPSPGAPHRG